LTSYGVREEASQTAAEVPRYRGTVLESKYAIRTARHKGRDFGGWGS
jgi:hypothetical protein